MKCDKKFQNFLFGKFENFQMNYTLTTCIPTFNIFMSKKKIVGEHKKDNSKMVLVMF